MRPIGRGKREVILFPLIHLFSFTRQKVIEVPFPVLVLQIELYLVQQEGLNMQVKERSHETE